MLTQEDFKKIRKLNREAELQRKQEEGTPRAKAWGGKTPAKSDRRRVNDELRKLGV